MVDITLNEMRDVLRDLGGRLNNTSGDRITNTRLVEIRQILDKIQTHNAKIDPKTLSQMIGKSVADAIGKNFKEQRAAGGVASATPDFNIVNNSVISARRDLVSEMYAMTSAFKTARSSMASFPNMGNTGYTGGTRNPGASDMEGGLQKVLQSTGKLGTIVAVLSTVAGGLIEVVKAQMERVLADVDVYRQLANLGQTFGGSVTQMVDAATSGHMSLQVFAKALETSSSGLRQLGGRDFASLSLGFRNYTHDMAGLGLTVETMNSGISDYVESLKYSGGIDQARNANFNKAFEDLILQATGAASAFGANRDQIIKNTAELKQDTNLQTALQGLAPEIRKQLESEYSALSGPMRKNFMAVLLNARGQSSRDFGILENANQTVAHGWSNAMADFIGGRTNETGYLEARKQSGQAGLAEQQEKGPNLGIVGRDGAVFEQMRASTMVASELSSTNAAGFSQAIIDTKNLQQKGAMGYDSAKHTQDAAVDAAENAVTKVTQKSTEAGFQQYIEGVDNYVAPAVDKLSHLTGTSNKLDDAFAELIKKLGPVGTLMAGVGLFSLANLAGTKLLLKGGGSILSKIGSLFRGGSGIARMAGAAEAGLGEGAVAAAGTGAVAAGEGAALTAAAGTGAGVAAGALETGAAVAATEALGAGAATAATTVALPAIAVAAAGAATTYATKRLITEWGPLKSFVSYVDNALPFLKKLDQATGMSPALDQYGPQVPPDLAPRGTEQFGPTMPADLAPRGTEQFGPAVPRDLAPRGNEQFGPSNPADSQTPEQLTLTTLNQIWELLTKQLDLSTKMHQDDIEQQAMVFEIFRSINDNTNDTARNILRAGRV